MRYRGIREAPPNATGADRGD